MTEDSAAGQEAFPDVLSRYAPLLERLRAAPPVDAGMSALVDEAVRVWSRPGFDTFLSASTLRFTPLGYQRQAAQHALRRMRGRAILADEAGLGKAIEAGLILAELRLRGLADRTLVIAPAELVTQWREELERQFTLPTVLARPDDTGRLQGTWQGADAGQGTGTGQGAGQGTGELTGADDRTTATDRSATGDRSGIDRPVVIAPLAVARRDPLRSALARDRWDLIIADEAHLVRSPRSDSGAFVRELRSRHLLLLTALPVENRLQDLYQLVSLVSPGLLGTATQFSAAHGAGPGQEPKNAATLRNRIADVMIRHRRGQAGVRLPRLVAETVRAEPGDGERSWYADLMSRVRTEGREAAPARRQMLRGLARLAGSSPAAAVPALREAGWEDLAARAGPLSVPATSALLLDRLGTLARAGEKVLVVTAFRDTLDQLTEQVAAAGIPAVSYHACLARPDKERAISAFRDDVPVLLSTESAGEGRDLRFCHTMIAMDQPWDPVQTGQRIGRLHRIGQDHDVQVVNLVARGAVEEHVLRVLGGKMNLYELVPGEIGTILGRLGDDADFESTVFDAYVASGDEREFAERMDAIGEDLARARSGYLDSRAAVDLVVGAGEQHGD